MVLGEWFNKVVILVVNSNTNRGAGRVEAVLAVKKIENRQAGHVIYGVGVNGDFAGILRVKLLLEGVNPLGLRGLFDDFKVRESGERKNNKGEKNGEGFKAGINDREGIAGKKDEVGMESDKIFAGADTLVVADQNDLN